MRLYIDTVIPKELDIYSVTRFQEQKYLSRFVESQIKKICLLYQICWNYENGKITLGIIYYSTCLGIISRWQKFQVNY